MGKKGGFMKQKVKKALKWVFIGVLFPIVFCLTLPGFAQARTNPDLILFLAGSLEDDPFRDLSSYEHPVTIIGNSGDVAVVYDVILGRNIFHFNGLGYLEVADDLNNDGIADEHDGMLSFHSDDEMTIEFHGQIEDNNFDQMFFGKGYSSRNYRFQLGWFEMWDPGDFDPGLSFGVGSMTSGLTNEYYNTDWNFYAFYIKKISNPDPINMPWLPDVVVEVKFFINGVQQGSVYFPADAIDPLFTDPLLIGNGIPIGGVRAENCFNLMPFHGNIDYIRIFKGFLPEEELNTDPNLVPWPIPSVISAEVNIEPDTLNLKSKGKWITAHIELPEGQDVADIDVSTLLLNDSVQAEGKPNSIGDYDDDGILDLMVKFNRDAIGSLLEVGDEAEITISGELNDGPQFEGKDTIKVINKGK